MTKNHLGKGKFNWLSFRKSSIRWMEQKTPLILETYRRLINWPKWSCGEYLLLEAVAQRCSVKKVLLKFTQNSQENTLARVSYLIKLQVSACNFIKKETLAQVFSCEFCEILKNTYGRLFLYYLGMLIRP